MENFAVFENLIFKGKLEWRFYFYCLFKQFSIVRYFPSLLFVTLKYWLRIVKRDEYIIKSFGFLRVCPNAVAYADGYSKKVAKHLKHIENVTVVSIYPSFLIKNALEINGYKFICNDYSFEKQRFSHFRTVEEMLPEVYCAYGDMYSPILENARRKIFVYKGREYYNYKKFFAAVLLKNTVNFIILTVFGIFSGIASLYFATVNYSEPELLFENYFEHFSIILLNILPVLILTYLLYLIFNSPGVSVIISSVFVILLTLVNYFKITIRDEPFLFEDLSVSNEALSITGNYSLDFTAKIVCLILLFCSVGLLILFFVKHKIYSGYVRVALTVFLLLLSVILYFTVYTNTYIYDNCTDDNAVASNWSATEKYQLRGFIYPFIHSSAVNNDKPSDT